MQGLFGNIYKGKTVLLTGHTGFKGSWLALWLKMLGARVVGYSLKPHTDPNLFDALKIENDIEHITGDIRDYVKLKDVIRKHRPEMVFHLAAQAIVRESYLKPLNTYETNIMGTVNLLEAIRTTDCVRVSVNITSDKCYENKNWIYGYRENDPMGGYDPYSSSKGCAELVVSSYRNSYFNPDDYQQHHVAIATCRAGNVIGGGDWSVNRIVPDAARALGRKEEILIRNPGATRPWQHVFDCLYGYLLLGEKLEVNGARYSQGWNFGPMDSDVLEVSELVLKIISIWGEGSYSTPKATKKELHEAKYLKLDCSKSRKLLGWKPAMNVDQAIELTSLWYKNFYQHSKNLLTFSENQLQEYSKLLPKN